MREIGFQCHTDTRKTFWQTRAGPEVCYYHMKNHTSSSCNTLNNAITLSSAGRPPNQPCVPNIAAHAPAVQNPPSGQPSTPRPANPLARARHTTDQTPSKSPVETDKDPLDANARQVQLEMTEDDSSNDAFDVVLDNTYNNECDYYFNDYLTTVNKMTYNHSHHFLTTATTHLFQSMSESFK